MTVSKQVDVLMSQGDRRPWLRQNYAIDFAATVFGRIDKGLAFARNDPAVRA